MCQTSTTYKLCIVYDLSLWCLEKNMKVLNFITSLLFLSFGSCCHLQLSLTINSIFQTEEIWWSVLPCMNIYLRFSNKTCALVPYVSNLLFSVTGAVLLSFGSVLLWAVLRAIIPPNPALCTIAGVGSGLALMKVSSSYLQFVDEQIVKK